MPTQRIEPAAAGVAITSAIITWTLDALHWLSDNAAAISVLVVVGGFVIQIWASQRNNKKFYAEERRAQAEERRAQAEELRAQEEHAAKMAILLGKLPDRGQIITHVEAVDK